MLRIVKRIWLVMISGILLSAVIPSALAQKLTAVTLLSTDSSGSEFGAQYWDTLPGSGNSVYDLFFVAGKPGGNPDGLAGSFLNGPSDDQVAIQFVLQPGDNTFTMFGQGGAVAGYHGMNLFFDGKTSAGISVKAPTWSGGNAPAFSANSGASTLASDDSRLPGAGTLIYSDGIRLVTLTDFSWAAPQVYSTDRVGAHSASAQGGPDFVGTFTLNVTNQSNSPAASYSYFASLGTMPEAQGFTRVEELATPASLKDGALHTVPASVPDGVQDWTEAIPPLDLANDSCQVEAELKIISSNFVPIDHGAVRCGYYLNVSDAAQRRFTVGITSDGLIIHTDGNFTLGPDANLLPFVTTDQFHVYRLQIANGIGTLLVDGKPFTSAPAGPPGAAYYTNQISFGDLSGVGASEVDLRSFTFSTTAAVQAPPELAIEVADVRLCWPSRANQLYQVQYQSEITGGSWVDVGSPVAGNGTTNCITDPVDGPRKFYRITTLN